MPIFDLNGKKYDVEDKYLDAFSKQNPDAYTIEEREGKRYKVRAKDYGNFRTHFDKPQQEAVQKPEDDAAFEANAERFRNGQPIERVTTQSVIDTNPELELGDQPYQYKPEVQEHILKNKPDMFKPKQSLMDAPLGINAPEGSDEKFQARINVAQKNLQDPEYQKGKVKSEFRVLSDSVNADLEKIEDAITSRQKAVRNIDWKPGMPSSRDDAKLSELRGQRTYLEGAKELIEDSQNILNAVEAEKDGSFFGGLGRGIRDKAFDIDTWTMGLSDLVGGLRLKSALEKAEKGENLTPAEQKLLDASVNNMAVNFYYRNDLGLGYQAGEITGQSIPFMLEFLVNPVSASGNAMAKRLLTYGLKRFGSAVNSKAIKAGTRLATDALAAGGITATTGMGHVLSGGVERLNRNYEYGLDEEGNLNVVNTHNMSVGEAFAKSATSAFLERQSEMIFNAFRGAPSLFKGIETSLPGGVNTFMNYVSNSRLGELWRGIKNNATMNELAKRTQFHGLGEEYLEEVYNNFVNIPLGEMTFEEATDLENNIVTFLGLAPTQVMFSAIGGIGYGVERYKAKRDLERTFGKMTEEQKRKLMELQEMGKLSTNKDIAFFLAETIKDESLTPEQKRAEIEYAYNLAKQNAIDEVSNTDLEDTIESENVAIDAVTNLSTGEYIEVDRWVVDAETGVRVPQPGNIVGWIGEAPVFVPEGMENTEENRIVLKPNEWNPETIQRRPAEEVKAINEEMIREEAAQQAEQEAKYAPEVINAQMQQGVPFDTPNAQIVPVAPMPEGNGWIVEEYALDTNNKVAKTPIVRELTNDEYRDILQAQLNAEEAAQEQISAEEQAAAPEVVEEVQPTEEADVKENLTTESRDNLSPVEEVAQPQVEVKPQTPVIPTKEDGSIDFVSYGKEGTFKTLGEKYGEKMPNKVAVTAKALAEDLKKAQNKLQKAEEAYDNAPIGREQKAEEARYKAKQELEAIQREANFWAEMDAEIKDAQARRESMLNPQAEVETSTEPMNVDEFVAQQLASGNIVLDKEDYKKETGYGDTEANAMNGGTTKLFGKNGMTIQEAGERLMEIDRENGTNFFDQLDSNSGRDALINVLGSVKSRKELNQYIATNRAEQAKRESEGLRNELEKQAMEANYASLEDYVLQMEAAEMENPFLNDRADEIMAIFAEEAAKYEQSLNNTENGQGTENEVVEGNDSILSEEQLDNTGRTEVSEESERIGDGTSEESESAHAATEVELKQEEGETTLQFAERAAEENRRRPLRKRAEEWSKALGVKVQFIEKLDDVDNQTAYIALSKGSKVAGWYEGTTGKVFFYMPNLDDISEVDKTYIHEVVAHKGLREMLGRERFNELCDKVWDMMPDTEKAKFIGYPGVNGNTRAAADEYIAYLSEKENLTPEEKTMWDRVVKALRDIFEAALNSIIGKTKLTDEDISNLIKASYANLKSGAEGNVSGESTKFRAKWRKGQLDKASRTIRRWLENNTRGKSFEIELPKATLDKVRKAMGRDFESHNITSNGIVHALKNHGENGLKLTGISIPLSKEDVELIPYIMTSPDRVEKASTDASGRESVRFYKDLSNGYVVVVEKEYKNSPDDMETITMWAELSSKATNAQQNAAPDTHVRNAILSIDIAKIRKDAEDAIEEDENLKEKTSFRVVKDKNGNKSLVGLHNISEAKLKKAIKQGGLANPSMAVIDMDKQSHVDYGDITLVAPSSLVDKKTGKNIGTYTADAWTPIYPQVEKQMSKPGAKEYSKDLEQVPSELRSKVRLYFNAYLEDGNTSGALNYWFLHDTGKNPPLLTSQSNDYTNEELDAIEAISNAGYYSGLNEEEKQKVLELFIEKQGGKDVFEKNIADRIETMKKNLQRPDIKSFIKKKVEQTLQGIEEYGYDYEQVSNFYANAQRAINNRGKIDEFRTFRNAQDIVNNEGLQGEFDKWLSEKEEQFGVEEYIFVGYNNNGDRKYIPNTLENASRIMKKEGRAGATGLYGFNHFVATLAPNAGSLVQIRKKKGNLSSQEEYKEFVDKWGSVYHDLAEVLRGDYDGYSDVGYYRLEEMPTVKNPKEYVKKEYGIDLSDEFMQKYNDFVSAIKNDFPARYFETKFERPVYLNEFAAAVVPQGTSKDVVDALTEAGLPVEKYESGNNEARMAAVDKVSSEIGGIRFRFIGERGARNLDKAEEATTRLDNLAVAREMEASEKDAKTIKMATGWERGADGLWRYETMDSETAIKDGDEAEIRRQIEAIEEEEKAYKKKAREEGIGPDEREEAYINFYRRRGFLEAQLAYVMAKNADVLTHISTSLHHVLDKTDSDSLFKAYPELEFVKVGFATELVGKSLGATVINGSRIEAINLDVKRSTPEELNGYLAHEIQHAIQEIEGFAPGGEPSMESPRKAEQKAKNISFMKDKLDKSVSERNSLLKQRNEINDKMSAWWDAHEDATREDMLADEEMQQYNREYDELSKQIDEADNTVKFNEKWLDATLQANTALGYEGYKKLAGEVEARNVTSRLGMTLEQRRASLASETEDVAREDQIFLKDGVESGLRFRISKKGKQIQAEVDKFTSKYNSKPVELIDPEMTDEEIEDAIDWQQTAKDLKAYIKESKSMGGYVGELDKILIFVENMKLERMEEAMFHENLHPFVDGGEYDHLLNKLYENGKDDEALSRARRFSDREPKAKRPLEFFNYAVSYGQVNGDLDDVLKYFDKEEQAELLNLLKENGYDYYQEQEGRRGNAVLDGLPRGEENAERVLQHQEGGQENNGRVSSESQEEKLSPTERKARLNELFNKVADMGLQGVLGNKEYTSLMVDIYKALPEEVRAEIDEDAIRLYGGSVAPAVSDYIGPKSKNSIMDKVVTIVREALRKIGFDLDLNANEVRYMAWRSKKPLDRNNMFEVAEDIDMKYRLKVGEYDGTTPDGGGTRFKIVYHGTGVYFDKFDHSFMSSGEGNQSFGWGTYVTDVEDVARIYARNHPNASGLAKAGLESERNRLKEAIPFRRGEVLEESKRKLEEIENKLANMKDTGKHLYYVDIPDNDGTNYISWDETLPKEQAERIKDAVRKSDFFKAYEKEYGKLAEERLDAWTKTTGGRAYKYLENFTLLDKGADKVISKLLSEAGFVGIEYPTNYMSGGNENGTKNYVIFNEKDLEIKEHTRFRAKEPEKIDIADKRSPIIKKYDETLKTGMFNFQEAFQDRMLSLKVLMDVIVGATGKKAKSFEDAYEAENQLSSTNKVDQERYIKKFYTPLVDYLKELSKKHGEEIVRRYIYCKSGLERNEVLRQRDADEAFNSAKEELDEKLAKNQLTQAQYDALLQQAEDERLKTLSEDVDYSGIRGMLFNVRAQELFEQYQSGALTEAQYKQKIEELKNKKADVVKNWKDFAIISVADLESRATSAELDELWSKINAATNETLRIDFESGMIDRETYEAEKNMMKYYVPLRDWENTKAEEMYEYRHDMTPAVSSNQKKAKGRESEAANPMATIALMAQNAIIRGNRNKMKQKLYSFVVNRPNDLASVRNVWYVRDANNQWEAQYANTSAASNQEEANQIIEQFEANMEVLAAQGDAFKGKLKQGMGYRASRKQKDEHVVAVMINGKEYGVYINGNPRAAQAVNGLTNAENVDDGYAWIDNLKRLYGGSLTSWDPNFVVPNFVRDTIHASTMTFLDRGVLGAVQYMANIPKMFAQVSAEISGLSIGNAKLHQYFEEFVNNGGETGYTEVHTLEDYKKEYQKLMDEAKGLKAGIKKGLKLPFQKMAKVLETANRIAEDVNRFNAYVTSREAGENIVNSISEAKNITVNFNRKGALHANSSVYGKVASFMSRWILFFNPSVQGIYQLVSKSKMNPKRATALGATIFASGFFMPLLNEMLVSAFGGGDEDDYWNQSDFKRRNNWMLFTGDGYVSIPLPPVLREIYGMGDIVYGVMTGHIPPQRAVYDVLNQVQSAIGFVTLLPEVSQEPDVKTWLKGFAPDLVSPFLDVMSNTNFMGRPIAKWTDYNETDPEYERVYKGVGKHWVGLSELLNEMGGNETRRSNWWGNMINPAMMEHLVTSYTGGIGKTINNFIGMTIDAVEGDKENMDVFRKAPIVPRFYTPNDEKTVYPGINRKFYEFEYQYNNAKKSLKKSQDGVNSGEHPEWQKYIDEMDKNGEKKFIEYFKKEQKKLKKLQDKLKEDPNNKEVEKKVYDKKAEISAESFKILSGQK